MNHEPLKTSVRDQFNRCAQFYTKGSQMADQKLLDLILRVAEPGFEDRVLDVACGTGFLVCEFAKKVRSAVGVDLSPAMLAEAEKLARTQGLSNTCFRPADGEALPYEDGAFDMVTCKLALHYFPDPRRAIREMKRVTRAGGRLVVVDRVASEDGTRREYHNRIEKLRTPSKIRVYSTSQIIDILKTNGLSTGHIHYYEQHQTFEGWLRTTGAPEENQQHARELMLQSLEGDLTGLKARLEGGQLIMTHLTAIIVAKALSECQ